MASPAMFSFMALPACPDRCLRTTGSSSTCRQRCQSCGPRRERWALLPAPLSPTHPFPGAGPPCSPASSPQLKEVVLKSSKVVRADVCVVGIGEWAGGQAPASTCTCSRVTLGPSLPLPEPQSPYPQKGHFAGLWWGVWTSLVARAWCGGRTQ